MNINYIMQHTPAEIATENNMSSVDFYNMIGAFSGLTVDEIADAIGDNTISADTTGAEVAAIMENAFESWYDREGVDRPSYTPDEIAADMILYTAWQANEQ